MTSNWVTSERWFDFELLIFGLSIFLGTHDTDHDEANVEGERNRRDDQSRTADVLLLLDVCHAYSKASSAMRSFGGVSKV